MAHLSESSERLKLKNLGLAEVVDESLSEPNVWFLHLPFRVNSESKDSLFESLEKLILKTPVNSTISFITSPQLAADFLSDFKNKNIKVALWVSVKLRSAERREGNLGNQHATLIVLTRYKSALKHTKTRISYTYCPECDRTTKDYGGKKHLYHEFGTLMSDVWRDITYNPTSQNASKIISRLNDLFGLKPYKTLYHVDFREHFHPENDLVYNNSNSNGIATNDFQYKGVQDSILINGDSIDILREIPSNSIHYCFADPPYNLNKKYETWNDDLDIEQYFDWCDVWISELARILKPGGVLSILNIPLWSIRHFKHLKSLSDLKFSDWIAWEGLSLPVRMIMPSNYVILNFSKGDMRPISLTTKSQEKEFLRTLKEGYCSRASCINKRKKNKVNDKEYISNIWWDIHRLKHNSKRVDHPCQLPPLLMQRLIGLYTEEGEIVLDPFNGAGTTTLVAHQMQRKYAGIEIDNYYHSQALARHNDIIEGLDPFRKNDSVPKAKNSHVVRMNGKYEISKKELQLYVKSLSYRVGQIPSRNDVIEDGKYPIEYFDNYFVNWAEVCAAARTTGMTEHKLSV